MFLLLLLLSLAAAIQCSVSTPFERRTNNYDVLVYGSTPSGIMAAVAASRHGASSVALLSQRRHIGGVCSGGLGRTDTGTCADEVIGGLALEFFQRSAASYATPQPKAPWFLEPHVAEATFRAMLAEANVTLLTFDQVASVALQESGGTSAAPAIESITTVRGGETYQASVFIDASYEGDLMARTHGVSWTYGRESVAQYNESGAGFQSHDSPYLVEFIDPCATGECTSTQDLLPLVDTAPPSPDGAADKHVQAYNFRLCVTNNASLRIPFTRPVQYDAKRWELNRRFWRDAWPNSTNPKKAAQAKVPSGILSAIPSTSGAEKFDMNNCGYNAVSTDMLGGSWAYPTANYSERVVIWDAHVAYTMGYLWFMSTDAAVPSDVRKQFREEWGFCGDEFADATPPYFSPQLYVREARRLVGDRVFTQNDAYNKTPRGVHSIGMGCYAFDSHTGVRYACDPVADPKKCQKFNRTYLVIYGEQQCAPHAGLYQMPLSLLMPKRAEVANLLVPVCNSASHVAYATVRMEPQFMILGHAAGVVAALAASRTTGSDGSTAVQDVDAGAIHAALLGDGALLVPTS